jgi:hypothetical protein
MQGMQGIFTPVYLFLAHGIFMCIVCIVCITYRPLLSFFWHAYIYTYLYSLYCHFLARRV